MKVFDCHTHVEKGLDNYDLAIIGQNIIFNSIASYSKWGKQFRSANTAISLILDFKDNFAFVEEEIHQGKISAIKIHSRIQQLNEEGHILISPFLSKIPDHLPIIYDAFYFGKDVSFQPNLKMLISWIQQYPQKKFIVAHAGGYEILKYFFHLREFHNVYYDLSLSLQYLQDSSCYLDLIKLIRFTDKKRILFGSDYPFASPSFQKEVLIEILQKLTLSKEEKELIFFKNAQTLFLKNDPI